MPDPLSNARGALYHCGLEESNLDDATITPECTALTHHHQTVRRKTALTLCQVWVAGRGTFVPSWRRG